MKSNSPIEVNVDKITDSCAEVDGDEDLLSPLCTNTEDTEDRSVVDGESYESQAARTVSFGERLCHTVPVYKGNTMLQWPKSTFFTPNKVMTARSVFNALVNANIDISEIHCLQWKLNGEVVVTSKTIATKEKFLRLNLLKVNSESYTLQDIDKPLIFLTIYNVPFELSDLGIIKHLAAFCEVLHYWRGKHSLAPNVYNGLQHYRICISKPIPNYLRFGSAMRREIVTSQCCVAYVRRRDTVV